MLQWTHGGHECLGVALWPCAENAAIWQQYAHALGRQVCRTGLRKDLRTHVHMPCYVQQWWLVVGCSAV